MKYITLPRPLIETQILFDAYTCMLSAQQHSNNSINISAEQTDRQTNWASHGVICDRINGDTLILWSQLVKIFACLLKRGTPYWPLNQWFKSFCVTYKFPASNTEIKHQFILTTVPWKQRLHFVCRGLNKQKTVALLNSNTNNTSNKKK